MSSLPDSNPKIPEGINSSSEHPLKEFTTLLLAVTLALVVFVVVLSVAVELLAGYLPFRWEQRAGAAVDEISSQYQDDIAAPDTERQVALQALGQRLLLQLEQLPSESTAAIADDIKPEDISFHLIHSDTANAFATLGGHIFVTDALIDSVSSENGLAMVLAHEIAHIEYRHPIQSFSRGALLQIVLVTVLGPAQQNLLGGVLTSTGAVAMLSFSREMELASDRLALALLRQTYGHSEGADEFFLAMAAQGDSPQWLEFAQTHPHTDKRLALIQADIAAVQADQRAGVADFVLTPKPAVFGVAGQL